MSSASLVKSAVILLAGPDITFKPQTDTDRYKHPDTLTHKRWAYQSIILHLTLFPEDVLALPAHPLSSSSSPDSQSFAFVMQVGRVESIERVAFSSCCVCLCWVFPNYLPKEPYCCQIERGEGKKEHNGREEREDRIKWWKQWTWRALKHRYKEESYFKFLVLFCLTWRLSFQLEKTGRMPPYQCLLHTSISTFIIPSYPSVPCLHLEFTCSATIRQKILYVDCCRVKGDK